jgi:hypothetical protein
MPPRPAAFYIRNCCGWQQMAVRNGGRVGRRGRTSSRAGPDSMAIFAWVRLLSTGLTCTPPPRLRERQTEREKQRERQQRQRLTETETETETDDLPREGEEARRVDDDGAAEVLRVVRLHAVPPSPAGEKETGERGREEKKGEGHGERENERERWRITNEIYRDV